MMADIFNNCLTVAPMLDNLAALSPHVAVGNRSPRKGEKSPLSLVVFFRPQFSTNTGLIRVKFIMVDCLRKTLKSLARSFAGTANLIQSTAQFFAENGSGKPSFKGVTAMSQTKSTQKTDTPTQAIDTPVFSGEQTTHTENQFSKVPQTILNFSDDGLASLPNDYLAETVKDLGKYQDYCHKMAGLAEAAMVRIESTLNSRVGGV